MFKSLKIIIITLIISNNVSAQIDESFLTTLTENEAQFIESYFVNDLQKLEVKDFNLKGKRVLFVTGSAASTLGSKDEYFRNINSWSENGDTISSHIIKLTEEEKLKYKYEFVITYWTKLIPNPKRLYRKFKKK